MERMCSMVMIMVLIILTLGAISVVAESPEGNVGNEGVISTWYVDQDFEDAYVIDDQGVDIQRYVHVTNKITGEDMPWYNCWSALTDTTRFYTVVDGDVLEDENQTKHLSKENSNSGVAVLNINDADGNPAPIVANVADNELIYLDMRIKRKSLSDGNVTLVIKDSNGKYITRISYQQNKYPIIVAEEHYGGESLSGTSKLTYPDDNSWVYIRMIMDFESKTYELYQGPTINDLQAVKSSDPSFQFTESAAENLYTIDVGFEDKPATYGKGTLELDDIKIYSVSTAAKPEASDVTVSGKPNVGATLTGTYGTYTDPVGSQEGLSYAYWETSDDILFADSAKITDDIAITEGETDTYVITSDEKGKYIRFCVVAVNEEGIESEPAYSEPIPYPIETVTYDLTTDGPIKNGNQLDILNDTTTYAAVADVTNSSSDEVDAMLISAWYRDDVLTDVYMEPVVVGDGALTETGVSTGTFETSAKELYSSETNTGITFKIFVWDGMESMIPLVNPESYVSPN